MRRGVELKACGGAIAHGGAEYSRGGGSPRGSAAASAPSSLLHGPATHTEFSFATRAALQETVTARIGTRYVRPGYGNFSSSVSFTAMLKTPFQSFTERN